MTPEATSTCDRQDAEWIVAGRPGYVGRGRGKRSAKLDRLFGEGGWRIVHLWKGRAVARAEALLQYEEAYFRFLRDNPDVLDWLCRSASDVYDIEPSNVRSGLDYEKQECEATHLQDITIRRCMRRLGRVLQGDHLVQIRGRRSEGYRLNPGVVPFHEPEGIVQPSLSEEGWWGEGSVEDFWQSNKVRQVRSTVSDDVLKGYLLRDLTRDPQGQCRIAAFGGSFNPVHLGHLRIAQDLVDIYGFSRVIFIPNGSAYGKKGLLEEDHRAAMVELAIAGEDRFAICRQELGRDRVVHTHETLAHVASVLSGEFGRFRLFLPRGSDIIRRMLGWRSLPLLLRLATVLVPVREGSDPWRTFGSDAMFRLHADRFRLMRRDYVDGLSSTTVRGRVKQGHTIRHLVPGAVETYVRENGLYR